MLRALSIRNFLLIDRLELELGPGLTVITGETGSGKSILIGALGLALGERADGDLLRDPAQRCVIELEVDADGGPIGQWCALNNIPADDPLIIRRQLEPNGRSRAFVNDTPVRLEQLRELGGHVVHVHSQHQTLLLQSPTFQLSLLDGIAAQEKDVRLYGERFQEWQRCKRELAEAIEQEAQAQVDKDYLQFQYDELEAARLVPGEHQELEAALARAEHAEELKGALEGMEQGIQGDRGVNVQLAMVRQQASKAGRIDPAVQALLERLQGSMIELKDIAEEAERLADQVNMDPRETERMRERHDLLMKLGHKHRVEEIDGLIAIRDGLAERMAGIGSMAERVQELERQEEALREEVLKKARAISAGREKAAGPLGAEVSALLHELGMPHAAFSFVQEQVQPGPSGTDAVRAYFTANRDRRPEPMDKVASGGELSRVMLAMISLSAATKELSTVIFDEIDTGVSGETAHRVGALLARMGRQRQVLAISHLPQIASKADTHLLVTKDHEAEHVHSQIRPLDAQERVEALARMLSGRKTTKAALDNARELLKNR